MQVSFVDTPGQTLYAFPDDQSLAGWATYRVLLTEGTGDNTGRYTANLDSKLYRIFAGATQPATWASSIGYFALARPSAVVSTVYTSGTVIYAYPDNASLTDYAGGSTPRIQLVEQAAPNLGRYTATLNGTVSQLWRAFIGATQPANWNASIELFDLSDISAVENACLVTLQATQGVTGVRAYVKITSSYTGRDDEHAFNFLAYEGVTEADGVLAVTLPWSALPGVGKYTFYIYDDQNRNRLLHRREVTVPSTPAAFYEDLV